ncbi:hypothetical protein [Adhaeribacter radiodurans]|uniref:Outer membrane beta-barrel protein n=1 Tax=Adhaeribacter radiodurans TaxID=2745197 RepID=A0A7L7L429_9BACT|nr:hypothetical protein [Adhaeribacter radiodurans]QMU27524.1 hypothetical protein HUW48_05490 [Adhaeribacter radiodurans]
MMRKYICLWALFLGISASTLAQTSGNAPAELNSVPPAQETAVTRADSVKTTQVSSVKPVRRVSYSMSAGAQFAPGWGSATYLEPSVMVPITKRFSGFASLNMISTFGNNYNWFGRENAGANYTPLQNRHFILHAGGNYLVNDRLRLTGSVWRDLSKNPMPAPVNLLMPGGSNGMQFRAHYKVSDNFSVSGGLRYSNGNAYQNSWYNPTSPYGY